jgi:hypothetical protein
MTTKLMVKHAFTIYPLAFVIALSFLWMAGCSSDGGEPVDGDSNAVDGDVDLYPSDGDQIADGDTDGDIDADGEAILDGDAEGESEGETDSEADGDGDYVYPNDCENPHTVWIENWTTDQGSADTPYIQRIGFLLEGEAFADGVNALAAKPAAGVFAAAFAGLFFIDQEGAISALADWPTHTYRDVLYDADSDTLVAISGPNLYFGAPDEAPTLLVALDNLTFVKKVGERLVVVSEDASLGLVDLQTPAFSRWYGAMEVGILDVCEGTAGPWLATVSGVWFMDWDTGTISAWAHNAALPSLYVTGLVAFADAEKIGLGPEWIVTDAGLAHLTENGISLYDGTNGLPYLNLRGVSRSGDTLLMPSNKGLITRWADGSFGYFHSRYWMPNWDVRDAAMLDESAVFVATIDGPGLIKGEAFTLEQKSVGMDAGMKERHNRMGMFSHCRLGVAGDLSTAIQTDDDNDGQWTEMYLASQCFRYAATQSEDALNQARLAKDAMLRLLSVTGLPGFFARSVIPPEECESRQCEGCGEWHLSENKEWCWKGDTSSDEYVGHIFGLSLYYDLIADETERAEIRDAFVRLHDGIIANGYTLVDLDGKVTTHGQFNPEWMEMIGVFGDAGLNGAMILGGLRATYHMSGEQRFLDAFYDLAITHGYADYVRRIEQINLLTHTNHDSEEMSFLAVATLIRYETEPCLMAMWQEGLDYLWERNKPENNPEFAMLYAWMSHNVEQMDLSVALTTLRQMYTNGIKWTVYNSHRADIEIDPKLDRHGRVQGTSVLPYDQKQFMRWAENPYQLDHDGNGLEEEVLTGWLLPYWLGRYTGIIGAETATVR